MRKITAMQDGGGSISIKIKCCELDPSISIISNLLHWHDEKEQKPNCCFGILMFLKVFQNIYQKTYYVCAQGLYRDNITDCITEEQLECKFCNKPVLTLKQVINFVAILNLSGMNGVYNYLLNVEDQCEK